MIYSSCAQDQLQQMAFRNWWLYMRYIYEQYQSMQQRQLFYQMMNHRLMGFNYGTYPISIPWSVNMINPIPNIPSPPPAIIHHEVPRPPVVMMMHHVPSPPPVVVMTQPTPSPMVISHPSPPIMMPNPPFFGGNNFQFSNFPMTQPMMYNPSSYYGGFGGYGNYGGYGGYGSHSSMMDNYSSSFYPSMPMGGGGSPINYYSNHVSYPVVYPPAQNSFNDQAMGSSQITPPYGGDDSPSGPGVTINLKQNLPSFNAPLVNAAVPSDSSDGDDQGPSGPSGPQPTLSSPLSPPPVAPPQIRSFPTASQFQPPEPLPPPPPQVAMKPPPLSPHLSQPSPETAGTPLPTSSNLYSTRLPSYTNAQAANSLASFSPPVTNVTELQSRCDRKRMAMKDLTTPSGEPCNPFINEGVGSFYMERPNMIMENGIQRGGLGQRYNSLAR